MRGRCFRSWRAVTTACAAGLTFLAATGAATAWERPHSDGTNSGFADVMTKPAGAGSVTIPNIGTFAPGVGPVAGPDGSVYIGNEQGKLWAFHADGSPYWSRDIAPGQAIVASPVVDSQGNVYVIGVKSVRDHTVTPAVTRGESTLHKFTAGGGWLFQAPFPQHGYGGATTAAPNIWKYEDGEAIMAPIAYPNPLTGGYETRLIAISTGGEVVGDTRIDVLVPTVTGGSDYPQWQVALCMVPPFLACLAPSGFTVPGRRQVIQPMPTAAIYHYPNDTVPYIIVSDGFQTLAGFRFANRTFEEIFRFKDDKYYRALISTPMVLPDGHTLMSTTSGMRFLRPNGNVLPDISGVYAYSAPTRLPDGRVVVVTGANDIAVLEGPTLQTRIPLGSASIVSAAASHKHLFVSTEDAFLTFDVNSLQQVSKVDWVGGGLNPPAIGPQGQVYAMASNILFVFPGPRRVTDGSAIQPGANLVETDPSGPTTLPPSQVYHPPLTANGNRLFACVELDGDDCGPGDHNEISLAWCMKQGYAKVQGYDVDSRKVKAETLDGRFCSKKKCKVFDSIGCEN